MRASWSSTRPITSASSRSWPAPPGSCPLAPVPFRAAHDNRTAAATPAATTSPTTRPARAGPTQIDAAPTPEWCPTGLTGGWTRAAGALGGLDQLDPVAEGIVHVDLPGAVQAVSRPVADTRRAQAVQEPLEILHQEGGVSLPGRPEVLLHAQVDPQPPAVLEPRTPAGGQGLGLGHPGNPEEALVEGDRPILLTGGHGQLHVIQPHDRAHRLPPAPHLSGTCITAGRPGRRGRREGR